MSFRSEPNSRLFIHITILSALVGGGCETAFDPLTLDRGVNPFYIYSIIDSDDDTLFARIQAVRGQPFDETGEPQFTVTSLIGSSSSIITWSDSLIGSNSGQPVHLYYSLQKVNPGETIQINVVRSDGAKTMAITHVPNLHNPLVDTLENDEERLILDVSWPGLRNMPYSAFIEYELRDAAGKIRKVHFSYLHSGNVDENGWSVVINIPKELKLAMDELNIEPGDSPAGLCGIYLMISALSEEWSDPKNVTSIVNGFGFIGSVGRSTYRIGLDPKDIREMGLEVCGIGE